MVTKNKTILGYLFTSTLLLFLLHTFAISFKLYWTVWWIDIISHLLGGSVVAFIAILLWMNGKEKRMPKNTELFIFVLLVGILWEVFELTFGVVATSDPGFLLDTLIDICMDLCGIIITKFLITEHAR